MLAMCYAKVEYLRDVRVGTSVGHREEERTVVLELEVLVGELLAIDGLATGALESVTQLRRSLCRIAAYVATGEVTTLEHELGDHAVEL
jgi:hypothetical protein